MRSKGVSVLGQCACVSITQHLTLNVIIRATNDSNLPSGRWRSKILSDFFFWKCFVAKLEHFLYVRLRDESAIFTPRKTSMHMNLDHADSGHFVLTWERRSLRVRLLVIGSKTVSMPPTKVCPQCKAAVPVRWKTCECCDLVFRSKQCNLRKKTKKHTSTIMHCCAEGLALSSFHYVSYICCLHNCTTSKWSSTDHMSFAQDMDCVHQ